MAKTCMIGRRFTPYKDLYDEMRIGSRTQGLHGVGEDLSTLARELHSDLPTAPKNLAPVEPYGSSEGDQHGDLVADAARKVCQTCACVDGDRPSDARVHYHSHSIA